MKAVILLLALAISGAAQAQYKCAVNGKATYSDVPCAANARYVGALEDSVSARAKADAELLRRKEAVQRNQIDRQQDSDQRQAQRFVNQQAAAEDSASRAKAARCADHKRDQANNQRAQARYQDWGWQQSLNNRQQEAKSINDNIFRECP